MSGMSFEQKSHILKCVYNAPLPSQCNRVKQIWFTCTSEIVFQIIILKTIYM